MRSVQTVDAGPRTSYEGVGKDGAMAQDLNRKWAADPGVVKAVRSTAPDNHSDETKLWV